MIPTEPDGFSLLRVVLAFVVVFGLLGLLGFSLRYIAARGIKLPLAVKRGYHRHFRPQGNAALSRPVLDAQYGYALAPMQQGIRLTTGVEFAPRDAPATPAQSCS